MSVTKTTDKYHLFWNGICSQWHPAKFEMDGVEYNCAEQAMMHKKALLFNDNESAEEIMKSDSPRTQKALGRQVRNFKAKQWSKVCVEIVTQINVAKFGQNPDLKAELDSFGDRTIVEASPYDRIWGIGRTVDDPRSLDPDQWNGQNLLGIAIMKARDILKQA